MQIKIDNKIYDALEGETILAACRRLAIYIPTLCFLDDLGPSEGLCRLCLVKTNQHRGLITSCQTQVADQMEIITVDEDIQKARTINLELLWADHAGKCATCKRNGECELQNLARELKVDVRDFVPTLDQFEKEEQLILLKESMKHRVVDDRNPSIYRDNQYCVECRRCIRVCKQVQTLESYGMNYRSIATSVGTPAEAPLDCIFCGQCANVCPTAAITEHDDTIRLEQILADPKVLKVVQLAPSVRFTLGEAFGLAPGTFVQGQIVTALRKLGFDVVFDATFTADLTIMEEAHELIQRITSATNLGTTKKRTLQLPMFTSCCPSWVLYVEKYWPQYRTLLSSCKSPQQMLGALIKTYYVEKRKMNVDQVVSVSVMPCTSKKYEAARMEMRSNDGLQDVDIVITTRELVRMIKKRNIKFSSLEEGSFDKILGTHTGAGILFGSTGGVMEAALRTAYETITQQSLPRLTFEAVRGDAGIRSATITIPKGVLGGKAIPIRVAVAHEIKNAKTILEMVKKGSCEYDFIEIMACPGGCLGGGGQPHPTNNHVRKQRQAAIYQRDAQLPIRKSHENPQVQHLYKEYLKHPGSERCHHLLHTTYQERNRLRRKNTSLF